MDMGDLGMVAMEEIGAEADSRVVGAVVEEGARPHLESQLLPAPSLSRSERSRTVSGTFVRFSLPVLVQWQPR